MNSHHQPISQVPPAVPVQNGRPAHIPYAPSPPFHHNPPYPGYAYQYPIQYARPPQQWSPYPIPMQMGRGYQQYPHMTSYQMAQNFQNMRSPVQHMPSPSIHSPQGVISPSPSDHTFPVPQPASTPLQKPNLAPPTPPPQPAPPTVRPTTPERKPFYPPLPWQSFEGDFPTRKLRRRKRPAPQSSSAPVELPPREVDSTQSESTEAPGVDDGNGGFSHSEASLTSQPPSEPLSTQPTTPSSTVVPQQVTSKVDSSRSNGAGIAIVPAVPNIPALSRAPKLGSQNLVSDSVKTSSVSNAENGAQVEGTSSTSNSEFKTADNASSSKPAPKSWADLVRSQTSTTSSNPSADSAPLSYANGAPAKVASLAEALSSFSVKANKDTTKISFLEPRGLVNTGNMCYMNSILQVLIFCVPFYTFLESIGRRAAHSFKSDTPMMDAMIMFMREFTVIDAALSVDQLRLRLKDTELEQYGEAFIPEFVYDVIRRLSRFASMRRGHQQDAEEFLGFLLEELHDECSRSMKQGINRDSSGTSTPTNGITSPVSPSTASLATEDSGWLEVGPKQRAAITRSSGAIATESPITKIFGGKLRSELRVPGMKSSVTLEPYQPLQLDIGATNVSNIVDALKGLTKPETLHGDFNSPRGPGSTATKHVTIETLPQVLILHLKRFQYDNTGGTQKIWKKVGYPLDLEIPKEVFPQHRRGAILAHGGLPKYRLISVVYHHGKNASGGHYTVDVRRQEGREWIRLDDTVIKRIRSEDVAEGGSEEDPKLLAAALEKHKNDPITTKSSNVYDQIAANDSDQQSSEKPWSQVNGSTANMATANKKWSSVANGVATPVKTPGNITPVGRSSVKDNKVAYILFYQRVGT